MQGVQRLLQALQLQAGPHSTVGRSLRGELTQIGGSLNYQLYYTIIKPGELLNACRIIERVQKSQVLKKPKKCSNSVAYNRYMIINHLARTEPVKLREIPQLVLEGQAWVIFVGTSSLKLVLVDADAILVKKDFMQWPMMTSYASNWVKLTAGLCKYKHF